MTLPDEVRETLKGMIGDGRLTLDDMTAFLEEQGHPRSRSAVGRYAQNIAAMREKLSQSREIATALTAEIGDDVTSSKQGRIIVEILRTLVFDHLSKQMEGEGTPDPQSFFFLAKAIKDVASANRLDQDFENKIREQVAKEEKEKAAETAETAARSGGATEEQVAFIRASILGIRDKVDG